MARKKVKVILKGIFGVFFLLASTFVGVRLVQKSTFFKAQALTIPDRPGTIVKQAEIDYFLDNLSSNSVYQDTYNKIMSDAAAALTATPKPPADGIFNSDDPYYPGTETYNPNADRTDYTNGLRDSNMVRNLALAYRFTGQDSYKDKVEQFLNAWKNGMTQGYEPHPQEQLEVSLVFPGFVLGASLIDEVGTYASFFESVTDQILDEGFASGFELTNSNFCALTHQVLQKTQCLDAMEGYYKTFISRLYADGSTNQAHIRIRSHWYNDVETSLLIRSAFILDRNGRTGFNYTASNGRNIKLAIDYAVRYALNPNTWPWPNNEPIDIPYGAYQFTAIPLAYHHYNNAENYWSVIQRYIRTRDDFRVFGRAVVFLGATSSSTTPAPTSGVSTPTPIPSSGGNILRNPAFDSGTANWTFYTNGVGSLTTQSVGGTGSYAYIPITTPGTNVQLYQTGFTLTSGRTYRLTFSAKSNTGHDLQVSIFRHSSPYTNYGLSSFSANLTSSWQTFTRDFTTSGFTGTTTDSRIMFWLAPFDASGDQYSIDSVSLSQVTTGSSPTPTPRPTVTPLPSQPTATPAPTSGNNIVVNGSFESGTSPWIFHTNGTGSYANTSSNVYSGTRSAQVNITTAGTNVQFYQRNLTLTSGVRYRLQFAAKSNTGHDMYVTVFKHSSPYTNYGVSNRLINLTNAWKPFTIDFTATGFSGTVTDARLMFYLPLHAKAGDVYYFDSVSVTRI